MSNILNPEQRRAVFLASLGGALEFYDFIIYVVFAKELQQSFFPLQDKYAGMLGVFAIFAIGYFVRPLGGLFFGHFGDSHGRKKTFSYTVFLMAMPTFLIGLLPTWHQLGIGASLLLVLLRLLQGLALGGEIPGSITFITEYVDYKKQAFVCALVFCGINAGLVLGSAMADILHIILSQDDFLKLGWRIAFLLGGVLGVVSFQMRRQLHETPVFQQFTMKYEQRKLPLLYAFQWQHLMSLLMGFALTSLGATVVALLYLFMPTYANSFLNYPLISITQLNTGSVLLFAIMNVIAGFISLKTGKNILLIISASGLLILALPIYWLIQHQHIGVAMIIISVLAGTYVGNYPARIAGLFKTGFRYTGYAIAYNIGFAVFGGLTPLVVTMLIHLTGNTLAPAYYLMTIAVFALIAVCFSNQQEKTIYSAQDAL